MAAQSEAVCAWYHGDPSLRSGGFQDHFIISGGPVAGPLKPGASRHWVGANNAELGAPMPRAGLAAKKHSTRMSPKADQM